MTQLAVGGRLIIDSGRDGTTVLAVGSDPAQLYEASAWEDVFVAEDQSTRGDHDAAVHHPPVANDAPTARMAPVLQFSFSSTAPQLAAHCRR